MGGNVLAVVPPPIPPGCWLDQHGLADLAADRLPDVAVAVFGGARPSHGAAPTGEVT